MLYTAVPGLLCFMSHEVRGRKGGYRAQEEVCEQIICLPSIVKFYKSLPSEMPKMRLLPSVLPPVT